MESQSYLPILKRVGGALVAIGLIDIGIMVYCIFHGLSYSSSFNVFAVVAGVFLLRGSLRAASIIRSISVFMLSGFLALLMALPFLQPIDLTLTEFRLSPGGFTVISIATIGFLVFFLVWIFKELGGKPVRLAGVAAGLKMSNVRVPSTMGVGLILILLVLLKILGRESTARAKLEAEQKLGPTFRYHVSSISIHTSSAGTSVRGVVTAWN